ncbi:rRNA adenine N-6-methyltransferase family protein [Georgenia deserti]|uniref:rRNA adenine N-6-methyltransferase family protein n=1 Tax=Georgenia deserti TaxID=2093781 RepID=A0ABW4L551_9MICO
MSGARAPGRRASARRASSAPATATRRWGSHELRPGWARRLVAAAAPDPGELVLDLGAGRGALTLPLTERRSRVVAVELHPGRAERLRQRVPPGVTVLEDDVLGFPLPGRPFRVVSNPPYAVAAALVRRLTAPGTALSAAHLVLPRWQVNRYLARPPRGFTAEVGPHVPASAFRPPPRHESAVLVLRAVPGRNRRRPRTRRR